MTGLIVVLYSAVAFATFFTPLRVNAHAKQTSWQTEWENTVEASKKEGKVAISIPASVDTKFLIEAGVIPAKDHVSVREFWQIENQSEKELDKVRAPAQKFAQTPLRERVNRKEC